MSVYNKKDAIRIVTDCAQKHDTELKRKSLLYICSDKHNSISIIELFFNDSNFCHLTGLKINSSNNSYSAKRFYEKCINRRLSENDFELSRDGTTQLKLEVLSQFHSLVMKANMIGDFNTSRPKLYTEKLAGGTKACVGFVVDKRSGQFVPNTVLKEDIRNISSSLLRVLAIFRKSANELQYSECTYTAKKVDWSSVVLPKEISYITLPSNL